MEDIDIFNKELLKHPKFFSYLKKNNQLESFKNIFHKFYNSKKTIEAIVDEGFLVTKTNTNKRFTIENGALVIPS